MVLTKSQNRLFDIIVESFGDDPLDSGGIEMFDHEERTALALERKGLLLVDGDMHLTEVGIDFAKTLKKGCCGTR